MSKKKSLQPCRFLLNDDDVKNTLVLTQSEFKLFMKDKKTEWEKDGYTVKITSDENGVSAIATKGSKVQSLCFEWTDGLIRR